MMCRLAMFVLFCLCCSPFTASAQSPKPPDYRAFDEAVARYLATRNGLRSEVPTLTTSTSSKEIASSTDVLAGAIQRARPQAKQGDFFDPRASRAVQQQLAAAVYGRDVAKLLLTINDEPTRNQQPKVYMRYPTTSSMATMPTTLLDVLPSLPKELEFRFMGRDLVLRDREAALVLDYVPGALPSPTASAKPK